MQLNYKQSGQGPAVILIHGLFGDLDNLAMVARDLAQDHRVIRVDVRNHGRSPRSDEMNYPLMAADVIALMDQLGLEHAILLGHSMGGKIAMQMALSCPERVVRLIVADIAPVTYSGHHQNVFAGLQALWQLRQQITSRAEAAATLEKHIQMPEVIQFLQKGLPVINGELIWRTHYPAIRDNYPAILARPESGSPYPGATLFIKGSDSDYILAQHRDEIVRLFPNANAKVIAGTGHWLHAEKPRLFNKLVREFVQTECDTER